MKTQLINFTIPGALLKKVDTFAKKQERSRSEILREAARRLVDEAEQRRQDFATIYASGKRVNMNEEETIALVDKVRNSLQINK